jgi:hypothetical protein
MTLRSELITADQAAAALWNLIVPDIPEPWLSCTYYRTGYTS